MLLTTRHMLLKVTMALLIHWTPLILDRWSCLRPYNVSGKYFKVAGVVVVVVVVVVVWWCE